MLRLRTTYMFTIAGSVMALLVNRVQVALILFDESDPLYTRDPSFTPTEPDPEGRQDTFSFKNLSNFIALEPTPRPPVESLVNGPNITGDVAWLMHLAVVGFAKCGTTAMQAYFDRHPQISMLDGEHCSIRDEGYAASNLVKKLAEELPRGNYIRGAKCPSYLEIPQALHTLSTLFPNARFVVGVRHPVLWFESFYNFRTRLDRFQLLPALELIGDCEKVGPRYKTGGVCTHQAKFHEPLALLGKTKMSTPEEQQYFPKGFSSFVNQTGSSGHEIFLYDISQIADNNERRQRQFRGDLQQFLHVDEPFSPLIEDKESRRRLSGLETSTFPNAHKRINICDRKYDGLRDVLLKIGKDASRWIRQYFIHAGGVHVSSVEFLDQALARWEIDPCELRLKKALN